jgi:uncharacterized membrane protein
LNIFNLNLLLKNYQIIILMANISICKSCGLSQCFIDKDDIYNEEYWKDHCVRCGYWDCPYDKIDHIPPEVCNVIKKYGHNLVNLLRYP